MLITNHVLSGALLGCVTGRPLAAAVAGAASHLALDAVPHFGLPPEQLMRVAVPDGLVGLTVIALLAAAVPADLRPAAAAGVLGACLPDMDKPGRQFFGRSPFPARFDAFHARIQPESPRWFPVEVATAALLLIGLSRQLLPTRPGS